MILLKFITLAGLVTLTRILKFLKHYILMTFSSILIKGTNRIDYVALQIDLFDR